MKKYLLLLLLPLIASCELYTTPDYPFEEGYDLRYDLPPIAEMHFLPWEIHDVGDILNVIAMSGNFGYQYDTRNEWKTPKEFYDDGGGDCEDFAIFCAYFMYIELGIEANLIIQYDHALLEYWRDDGIQVWIYVEGAKQVTQPGMEDTISDRIPYYEMMYRAHYLN